MNLTSGGLVDRERIGRFGRCDRGPSRTNGQGVMEHVARIPAPLDPLKRRVVALEVERVPRNTGRIPLRISEVDVGVVDHRAVADVTRYRNAARVHEQVPIEARTHAIVLDSSFGLPQPAEHDVVRIESRCGDAVASDATVLTCPPYVARPSIPPATS